MTTPTNTDPAQAATIRPVAFGRYCLLERVSVGGMAEVFRARPFNAPGFKRFLAVKRILPNLAEDAEFIDMFVHEAKISVQLNHRNVCQIYELGRLNDSFFIVMEYIAGKNLLQIQNRFRRQKKIMSVTQAAFTALRICEGLDYAHRKVTDDGQPLNIIHRDISPQNVLVSWDGEVKLIDFGIARAATKNEQTQVGVLKGKFGYMSPEQANGLEIDRRSDIFAVGTLLWEMLTARRLFNGETEYATLDMVRKAEVEPPSAKNNRVPPEIDRIVARALARDTADRYQWASEMAADLRQFLAAIKPPYSEVTLSAWMVANWKEDLEAEKERSRSFAQFVSLDDVVRYNEKFGPATVEEEGEPDDEATRVFDGSKPAIDLSRLGPPRRENTGPGAGNTPSGRRGELLAEPEADAIARILQSTDEIRLPDSKPTVAAELEPERAAPRQTARLERPSLDVPIARVGWGAREWILTALLVVVLSTGGILGYLRFFGPGSVEAGSLRIDVAPMPGLIVAVNGRVIPGSPPFFLEQQPAGAYAIEVRHPDYETLVETVNIEDDVTTEFRRELVPLPAGDGDVTLTLAQQNAQVFLDGNLIGGMGTTRQFVASIDARHVVEVYLPGHFVETYEFTLGRGQAFERSVTLRPVTASIQLRSEPAGEVSINDEPRGATTERLVVENLDPAGVYELVIEPLQPGFREYRQTIVFDTYYDLRLQPRLRRLGEPEQEPVIEHGFITTGDAPSWFRVFVDGRDTGFVTPITAERPLPLKAGSRTIAFVRAGRELPVVIELGAGQTVNVEIPAD